MSNDTTIAYDTLPLWQAALEANQRTRWLGLAGYLESRGQETVAIALRQAIDALLIPGAPSLNEQRLALNRQAAELLPIAAIAGQVPIVQMLLERGIPNYNGALAVAARAGNRDVVCLLLEHDCRNRANGQFLFHARPPGDPWAYDTLMAYSPPEEQPLCNWDELCAAGESGNNEVVELMLEHTDADGRSEAVRGAAKRGHTELVNWLLDQGASLESALRGAVFSGPLKLLETLLDRGAVVNEEVFSLASCYRNRDIIELLLQHGASASWGLSNPIAHHRRDNVEFLLERGGVPSEQNLNCARSEFPELLPRLLERTAFGDTDGVSHSRSGHGC